MDAVSYWQEVARLRGEQIAAIRVCNFSRMNTLINEEKDLICDDGPDINAEISLKDLRKQNLRDALKSITRAVEAIV